jgi:Ca2+-binding RTX toxin-like protein
MADFIGTAGKDKITGTEGDDSFDMSQGGNDKVIGRAGDDVMNFGAALGAGDKIDGGNGFDTVVIDGDYSGGLAFADTTLTSVEWLELAGGHSYTLSFVDANFTLGFVIDGRDLGAGDALVVDARLDTDTDITMFGGAGNDRLRGGAGGDTFLLTKGGSDNATGGAGNDGFAMGGTLDASDKLDGGAGSDLVSLLGDYTGGLDITKTMLRGIETMILNGAFDYNLTLGKKVVDGSMTIDASGLLGGHHAIIDASAEKSASVHLTGSRGDDIFTGGGGNDTMDLSRGGDDTAYGGDGNDSFSFGEKYNADDRVDGGAGFDSLVFGGDFSSGFTFKQNAIDGIEQITLLAGNSYDFTMVDGNVAAGARLTITASGLPSGQTFVFDGTAETDGSFSVTAGGGDDTLDGSSGGDTLGGGAGDDIVTGFLGDDTLVGGSGDDVIDGGAGTDRVNGGTGADVYVYHGVSESTGAAHDTMLLFEVIDEEDAIVDKIDLDVTVTGVDKEVLKGDLNEATFDDDLTAAIGADELGADHAVVFIAEGGDLEAHTYIIVDANGTAGYQVGEDYVFEVELTANILDLSVDNFI